MFPSPYGVTVIKSNVVFVALTLRLFLFPSPYGVTVIKSNVSESVWNASVSVSVPLRGNGN